MSEDIIKSIKCAIYTRKSTDEGLEKEFNTLEAQREAGLNYVKSQVHQGWEALSEHYDDGGYSGGNMNRPALKRLFEDIRAGKVDMIVVYKIDRLTRSLTDFSKMMELFDEYEVSFVSVTQNFNTYDSMGRLTLNVLLSFAQFEREVSGERIRDKISASKKKGMWMGGPLPLGYDLKDKKLVINPDEAEVVRLMFEKYLVCKSPQYLADWLNNSGYLTKMKVTKSGKTIGGKLFNLAISRITIWPDKIKIQLKNSMDKLVQNSLLENNVWVYNPETSAYEMTENVAFLKWRQQTEIYVGDEAEERHQDKQMIVALVRAFGWQHKLERGNLNIQELAQLEQMDRSYMGKIISLTTLAPDIVESILAGLQPRDLTLKDLIRNTIPVDWNEQRKMFGFRQE